MTHATVSGLPRAEAAAPGGRPGRGRCPGPVVIFGLLHPGEMGAVCGAALRDRGHDVIWAGHARSAATSVRAQQAGLRDVDTVEALIGAADAILSICPPHTALDTARQVVGFTGLYLDANAIAPGTTGTVAAILRLGGATVVDGGIVGPPPEQAGTTRLYLSGPRAPEVAAWWEGTELEAVVLDDNLGTASALKATYSAWSKGSAALLLAVMDSAIAAGVGTALLDEWTRSQPELATRLTRARDHARDRGWRWAGEMEEIAGIFSAAGQPDGFARAASEVFGQYPRPS